MAFRINKISEEQVRNKVSENKNSENPLGMLFTYEYVACLVPLYWQDLLYAIKNNFMSHQSAIDYAMDEVKNNPSASEDALELACMLKSEAKYPYDIYHLVNSIVLSQKKDTEKEEREKFLFISLNWVYDHKDDYENPTEVIDILCDEIEYPVEIKNLLSFMPSPESETKSSRKPREQVFMKLASYLENQKKKWNMEERCEQKTEY